MNRATRGVTVHAHTLRPCHALCERHRWCQRASPNPAQSTPRPPGRCGFATSTLRSCCAPPPSPAAPTQATPAKLSCPVLNPRRPRAFHAAHAPRQRLTQACTPGHPDESGFLGVEHPASQAGTLDSSCSATPFFNPCFGTKCRSQKERCNLSVTGSDLLYCEHAR